MKAKLEGKDLRLRGVTIWSENEEEKQVLLNIWNQGGRPVALGRSGGSVTITLAPTPEE